MKSKLKMIALSIFASAVGGIFVGYKMNEVVVSKHEKAEQYRRMYRMMERWMRIKQNKESLEQYFIVNNYKKIAIYGFGNVGNLFFKEINDTSISVEYGMDRTPEKFSGIPMYSPSDDLPDTVDAVIVTPIIYYSEIEAALKGTLSCPIISLENVIYEIC